MDTNTNNVEVLLAQLEDISDKFEPNVCNDSMKQSITFTVPDLIEYTTSLNVLLDEYYRMKFEESLFNCKEIQ